MPGYCLVLAEGLLRLIVAFRIFIIYLLLFVIFIDVTIDNDRHNVLRRIKLSKRAVIKATNSLVLLKGTTLVRGIALLDRGTVKATSEYLSRGNVEIKYTIYT